MPSKRIARLARRFTRDESGAVALIFGLLLTVLLGFVAFGVDVGNIYLHQRDLQTRADLSAVSAVRNLPATPTAPRIAAEAVLTGNGDAASDLEHLIFGRYEADPTRSTAARFAPLDQGDADVNAVRVGLTGEAPLSFGRLLIAQDTVALTAGATAARRDLASFSLGSRVARIDDGALNTILGTAFGSAVNLSAVDYNALASSQIELLPLLDALAIRTGLQAGDYTSILNATVLTSDLTGALGDVAAAQGLPVSVLSGLAAMGTDAEIAVADLISVEGGRVDAAVANLLPMIDVSALDILRASADVLNGGRIVNLGNLSLGVPGVTSTTVRMLVGERAVDSGWLSLGEAGVTLSTAQTRLQVEVDLNPTILTGFSGLLTVAPVRLRFPLYVEVAGAQATLIEVNCDALGTAQPIARFNTGFDPISGGTSLATLLIADFSQADFTDMSRELNHADLDLTDLPYADLLRVNLQLQLLFITLTLNALDIQAFGRGIVGVSDTSEMTFAGDATPPTPRTASFGSTSLVSSLVSNLLGPPGLEVQVNPLGNAPTGNFIGAVAGLLLDLPQQLDDVLTAPLNAILNSLTDSLGIGLGQADLTLNGVRCGVALVH